MSSWVRNALAVTGWAALTGVAIERSCSKYLEKKAVQAVKENKLTIGGAGEIYAYSNYGVVKSGEYTSPPGTFIGRVSVLEKPKVEVNDDAMIPIARYLHWSMTRNNFFKLPFIDCSTPLRNAESEWEFGECQKGDLGHVRVLKIAPSNEEDEQKIDYLTEVATLALGMGYSMKEVYDVGPNPYHGRVAPKGAIAIANNWGTEELYTNLGKFGGWKNHTLDDSEKKYLGKVQVIEIVPEISDRFGIHQIRIESVTKGTRGQALPLAEPISFDQLIKARGNYASYKECCDEWKRLRDPVFLRVNKLIQQSQKNSVK